MKYVWIIAVLGIAVFLGGIFIATQNPQWMAGFTVALVSSLLPGLLEIFTPLKDNKPLQRMKRMRDKWGGH
jgi:hypothetical protein